MIRDPWGEIMNASQNRCGLRAGPTIPSKMKDQEVPVPVLFGPLKNRLNNPRKSHRWPRWPPVTRRVRRFVQSTTSQGDSCD